MVLRAQGNFGCPMRILKGYPIGDFKEITERAHPRA
jgi:hypothetical protein